MESNVLVKVDAIDNTKAAFDSLKTNIEKVSSTAKSVSANLENLQPVFEKMSKYGSIAFGSITAAAGLSIKAYGEVERAQRQLEHAVIDVSKGTSDQVKQIGELTDALEKKSGVDSDSLKMGVAQLSTFGLSTKSVIGLTKSLADLTVNQSGANAGADDYIQSANNMAKALNGQFGILEKMGIRFTQAQQDMITNGTETEKVSAIQEGFAQNLRETTDTIKGTDLAAAKSARTFENMSETIGKSLAPAFEEIAKKVGPVVEKITEWAEKNPQLTADIIIAAGAIAGLVGAIGAIGLVLPAIITGFGILGGAFAALFSPITLIVGAIALVGFGLYELWKNWDQVTKWISEAVDKVTTYIGDKWHAVMDTVSQVASTAWEAIKSVFWTSIDFIVGLFATVMDLLFPGWQATLHALIDAVTVIFAVVKDVFQAIFTAVSGVFSKWSGVFHQVWSDVWNKVKDVFTSIWESLKKTFDSVVDGIKSGMETLVKPIQKVIDLAKEAMDLAGGALSSAGGAVSSSISDIINRGSSITGKAVGGPVSGGTPYIVGEVGPELFVPSGNGTIIPNNVLAGAGAGGGNIYLNISGTFMDDRQAAQRLGDEIIRTLKQNVRL